MSPSETMARLLFVEQNELSLIVVVVVVVRWRRLEYENEFRERERKNGTPNRQTERERQQVEMEIHLEPAQRDVSTRPDSLVALRLPQRAALGGFPRPLAPLAVSRSQQQQRQRQCRESSKQSAPKESKGATIGRSALVRINPRAD